MDRVRAVRVNRDAEKAQATLAALGEAARGYAAESAGVERAPIMNFIIDAVRARATVGEIADVLRDRWGAYRPA